MIRADAPVLLDVRDVDEWIAESSSPYGKDFAPRKGRLPGATWIEWYRFMKPSAQGQVIKTPDEVIKGVDTFNKEVITENFNRAVCKELVQNCGSSLI